MVYFQGVGTKGVCGNSFSNRHLVLAVTVAAEVSMTPRQSILLNRGDAVSTGRGNWFFSIIFHNPSCSPVAASLVSVDLEPTASHPYLISPGEWHFMSKSVLLTGPRRREEHSEVNRVLETCSFANFPLN